MPSFSTAVGLLELILYLLELIVYLPKLLLHRAFQVIDFAFDCFDPHLKFADLGTKKILQRVPDIFNHAHASSPRDRLVYYNACAIAVFAAHSSQPNSGSLCASLPSWSGRMIDMKEFFASLFLSGVLCLSAFGAPLSSNARTVVPSAVQQMISVDYRALRDSATARALKDRVLPDSLKQFEKALKGAGIDPEKDVEQLTFVNYRSQKGPRSIGIAQGPFKKAEFLQKMRAKKVHSEKYQLSYLYPMGSGMQLVFLDPSTILFGENAAIKGAIDVRDNGAESLESNNTINDLITDVDSAPMWSVLDQLGTQNMMRSALGQAASLGDYDVVKKRLLASDYTMNFSNGVTFDLNVKTSDTMTAASMATLLKAGVLYRKMSATPTEKMALENTTVDNSHDMLQMHFKSDDQRFQSLLKSDLFAAVSK